jgi:hypothetical protein
VRLDHYWRRVPRGVPITTGRGDIHGYLLQGVKQVGVLQVELKAGGGGGSRVWSKGGGIYSHVTLPSDNS